MQILPTIVRTNQIYVTSPTSVIDVFTDRKTVVGS